MCALWHFDISKIVILSSVDEKFKTDRVLDLTVLLTKFYINATSHLQNKSALFDLGRLPYSRIVNDSIHSHRVICML